MCVWGTVTLAAPTGCNQLKLATNETNRTFWPISVIRVCGYMGDALTDRHTYVSYIQTHCYTHSYSLKTGLAAGQLGLRLNARVQINRIKCCRIVIDNKDATIKWDKAQI